jgi:prevent-host-death family protein
MPIDNNGGHLAQSAMTKTMTASECKAKFLDVLDQVGSKGERIIVTRDGKPIAEIIPFVERPDSIIGALKGAVTMMGDIEEPTGEAWEAVGHCRSRRSS